MERRSFLKNLFGIGLGVTFLPASTIVEQLSPVEVEAPAAISSIAACQKMSSPFTIRVINKTYKDIYNTEVFGAVKYLSSEKFADKSKIQVSEAEIMSTSDMSYRDMMQFFMMNPVHIGQTYVHTRNQRGTNAITIKSFDNSGYCVQMPLMPHANPYDTADDIGVYENAFVIDGYTSIIIPVLQPRGDMTIRLYPSNNLNPARSIGCGMVSRNYRDSNIIVAPDCRK